MRLRARRSMLDSLGGPCNRAIADLDRLREFAALDELVQVGTADADFGGQLIDAVEQLAGGGLDFVGGSGHTLGSISVVDRLCSWLIRLM